MENLTQQQIEALIQFIDGAEDPATVTNTIVAAVLAFLADKTAGMATAQALLKEIATRQTADTDLLSRINQLQQLIQSIGAVIYLDSMGEELDGRPVHIDPGMVIYDPNNLTIKKCTAPDTYVDIGCNENVLYCNKVTNILYRWSMRSLNMIQVGAANIRIVNNLDTNDGTKALSAKQGKILKTNIETLNSNINALLYALANIAFKSLPKPTMGELDWGGDKCVVTINNTLAGCNADKSGIQQVNEGNNLVISITADNDKLLRSVTASVGSVVIAQNKASATVTISNVMSDLTVTINANATAKALFSASISDSRVSGTGAASGIVEGSAWSSQLSLNNTAEEGAAITNISASMAGGGEISVDGNTISTSFVTGNITITAVVRVVGRFNVTLPSDSRLDFSNGATSVPEGSSYSNTLSLNNTAAAGETINNLTATMEGGGTISVNGNTISTANVTGNIVISASVGVQPAKVHSYKYPATSDSLGDCLADTEGGFNLYLYNSTTKSTFTNGGPGNNSNAAFQDGWYGNGKSTFLHKSGSVDAINIQKDSDFTLIFKDWKLLYNGSAAYNSNQLKIPFFDEGLINSINEALDVTGRFFITVENFSGSPNYINSGNFGFPRISYMSSGVQNKTFASTNSSALGGFADTQGVAHDVIITYNSTSKKATAWVAKVISGTKTLKLTGEISVAELDINCIQMPAGNSLISGLDIYNYAMTEQEAATATNSVIS